MREFPAFALSKRPLWVDTGTTGETPTDAKEAPLISEDLELDRYEQYEELINPSRPLRKPRRPTHVEAPEETPDTPAGFIKTYRGSRHEAGWLLESLSPFHSQELILDVLSSVKGGKEASVYRCEAHPGTGAEILAAKVYRPKRFRNLRNDAMYREGRPVLTGDGQALDPRDHRTMRALQKKSAYGEQVKHVSWLMYEYATLETLHQAGAAVPRPVAAAENAILMGFCGDRQTAAPLLIEVDLDRNEARSLFKEAFRNLELLLQQGWIHGDLSAYNILYWEGKITFIDFPQVTSTHHNPNAAFILKRDITRVCEYFEGQGVSCDPDRIMNDLWSRYGKKEGDDQLKGRYEFD